MEVRAAGKYIRVSPSKAREVAQLIKGKSVNEAMSTLTLTPKKASNIVKGILNSAIANAKHRYGLTDEALFVKLALVDKGPTLKRVKPRARGRADLVRKRTSHITVILESKS